MTFIEVCRNAEWLTVYGPLSDLADNSSRDELAGEWFSEVCRRIEDAIPGTRCEAAKGQRMLCHGWNGANTFDRKSSGLGTFDSFSDAQWETAVEIADAVASEIIAREAAAAEEE